MFKKNVKFSKVLMSVFIFCAVNFVVTAKEEQVKTKTIKSQQDQENVKLQKQQMLEDINKVKQEVLNNFNKYDKKDYQVEGFTNKIYYKKGLPILVYEHDKTKAKIVLQLLNDEITKSSKNIYFFRAFDASDKGLVHICEHCLAPMGKINNIFSSKSNLDVCYETTQYGIFLSIPFDLDGGNSLRCILKDLRHPPALDDEEMFRVEKNRIINEQSNTSPSMIKKFFDTEPHYFYGGIPEQVNTVKHEEFKKFFNDYIHPSNLLVTRYICDVNPAKIKEYLNLLNEEYLKYFNYKDVDVKYSLKDNAAFCRKSKYDLETKQSLDGGRFEILAQYDFDMLNLNAKQRDALSLVFNDKKKVEQLRELVQSLGYKLVGCSIENRLKKYNFALKTNDSKLCQEEVIRKNLKIIIDFLKNEFKNFTEEQVGECSCVIDNIDKKLNNFLNKPRKYKENMIDGYKNIIDDYYKNYKSVVSQRLHVGSFFDFLDISFAKHNNVFSDNIFNVNENNEILEDENVVIKNIKENLDVFDILSEKGPTRIDVRDLIFVKEKEWKNIINSYDKRAVFFVPVELKEYNNDKWLFEISAYVLLSYLDDVLGFKQGLVYDKIRLSGLDNSNIIGYFFENVYAKNSAIKYLYGHFYDMIKDFKMTEEEFKRNIERLKAIANIEIKGRTESDIRIKIDKAREILESFSKGKGEYRSLNKELKLADLKKFILFFGGTISINSEILLKNLTFLNKLNEGEKRFNEKYPDEEVMVTQEMVKDYKEMVFDNYYNLFEYSTNFYKNIFANLDRIKLDDVIKVIKSASLIKRVEVEKLNDQLKCVFDTSLNTSLNASLNLDF